MNRTKAFAPSLAIALLLAARAVAAPDVMVSANDGKFARKDGVGSYPRPAPSDSLAVIALSPWPPRITALVEGLEHSIQGPPQAVAITPDLRLALVGAPDHYDPASKTSVPDAFVQVVDLKAPPPRLVQRVALSAQPNGLSISPDGRMALAAQLDGQVSVLAIDGGKVSLVQTLKVGPGRLSGVSFTHDGKTALVALRDQGGLAVLDIKDGRASLAPDKVSTGVAPYSIDVTADGKLAAVSAVGLAGLSGVTGTLAGDADLVTLVDTSRRPFRAVRHITVPSVPEGVALSPDGRWLAVQAMDGSNLTRDNPGFRPAGKVVLFALRGGRAVKVDEKPSGQAAQGVAFAADSRTLVVQFNEEHELAVFKVSGGKLLDTHVRLHLAAGPASLRGAPR